MGRLTRVAEAHVRHTVERYVVRCMVDVRTDAEVDDEASTERHWSRLLELFGEVLQPSQAHRGGPVQLGQAALEQSPLGVVVDERRAPAR